MPTPLLWMLLACPGKPDDTGGPADTDSAADTDGVVHDDLSMPAEPTLDPADFASAAACVDCHPDQVDQWRTSNHAYAMVDPVFQALVGVRQADLAGTQDQFCLQCHTAIGTRGGEITPGFQFSDLSPIVMEGITCESCHKVSGVARVYNSGHELDPTGPERGNLVDPVANAYHDSLGDDLFDTPEFCGACHDVIETSGLPLERPYEEWESSPAYDAGANCQSCHMPTSDGEAAVGAGVRTGLHDHTLSGVEVPLLERFASDADRERIRARVQELLTASASLDVAAAAPAVPGDLLDVRVTIQNDIDAHNLPTGSTFLRQIWIELVATDGEGNELFVTGDLDANGDLRNHWSELDPYGDEDLVQIGSGFVDETGAPTLFPWRAAEHLSTSLSPLYARTYTYFVPTPDTVVGPIHLSARLRFRPVAPFLLRALGLPDLVERVETYEIDVAGLDVPVATP